MRVIAPGGVARTDGPDFSDLTTATQTGPAYWDEDGTVMVIPFTPEPTTAEQQLIRRRLMTHDATDEAWVTWYVATLATLDATGQIGPLVDLVRGLARERLRGIDTPDATTGTTARTANPPKGLLS